MIVAVAELDLLGDTASVFLDDEQVLFPGELDDVHVVKLEALLSKLTH